MVKVAIITGASSGIGRSSAIALSKKGWTIVLFARRLDNLQETKSMCSNPSQCLTISGDVSSEEDVAILFQETVNRFGGMLSLISSVDAFDTISDRRLDLLFNNAGTNVDQIPLEELSFSDIQKVVNVNLIGALLCTREAIMVFKAQSPQGGRIINNGSISAYTPRPHSAPYTASKHAILGLTKSTLLDGRKFNITCTQIDVGNARTDMSSDHLDGALQADGRVVPELMMNADHVGDAVAYIAELPHEVTVLTFNIMATGMPFVGRG
ncbi:Short chain dehydrogenase citE [Sparassis crispa]|uniref:Short chain dehydrogenase citE n=1 Tax=Sparassis crispa TaxID=139825 RepID=A0A401GU08_9APHY|nr:Short chain dehydrogenase citE [Sparassis crispa]GBE85214.1 Short chain dehydrogenase citE [Sparassis crispa]